MRYSLCWLPSHLMYDALGRSGLLRGIAPPFGPDAPNNPSPKIKAYAPGASVASTSTRELPSTKKTNGGMMT